MKILTTAAVVILAFPPSFLTLARAKTLAVYDLDSLIHMSTEVVEAEITRCFEAHDLALVDVKITFVHKGAFKKGQSVVVGTRTGIGNPTKIKKESAAACRRRAPGDHRHGLQPTEHLRIPEDAVIYVPLPGGMRLVQGDHVFSFSQRDDRGTFVAKVPVKPDKTKLLTVERFREKVQGSLRDTQEWARLVEAKQDKLDVPRLLKLRWTGPANRWRGRLFQGTNLSPVREDATTRTVERRCRWRRKTTSEDLAAWVRTSKGRDYLFAKVTDAAGADAGPHSL